MLNEDFIEFIENAIKFNWDLPCLSDYKGIAFTYGEVAEKIDHLHLFFKECNINKGDKIALVGKNSANWGIIYLSVITYGAVIVPILPDFVSEDIQNIVNHSDSLILICSDSIFETLDLSEMNKIRVVLSLPDFSIISVSDKWKLTDLVNHIERLYSKLFPDGSKPTSIHFDRSSNNELAIINYTSGTTGFSKGVMLTYNNLVANILYARKNMPLKKGDSIVSFLPLAHVYGCTFEFLFPFSLGCQIVFLTKTPSPIIIIEAFKDIKPHLILSVPLIIEKIYKKQILHQLGSAKIECLLLIPLIRNIIYNKIKWKLIKTFGGRFHEIVIGGAALNAEVELFLHKIKFPFAVGYGMTECGPLISYAGNLKRKLGSAGKIVDSLEIKIESDDPKSIVGEILVRGENVMLGYYKNEAATNEAIDNEGWLHTGDLGLIDNENYVFIKGRCKDMILGPSGQNIYPEQIEAKLNNMIYIQESIIIERDNKLIAIVYPDYNSMKADGFKTDGLEEFLEDYRKLLNSQIPAYMAISRIQINNKEFEKTPKKNIKRYLYI